MAADLVVLAVLILLAGGAAALLAGRRTALASGCAAGATLLAAVPGMGAALLGLRGASASVEAVWAVPGGDFLLSVDALSGLFLLAIFVLAPLCALYGAAYLKEQGEQRPLGGHWFFYTGLVAAMALVVTAAQALLFLAVWELMSLASFFLVVFDHRQAEVRRAAWIYLIACHLGGAFLCALLLFAGDLAGSLAFADFARLAEVEPKQALVLFVLALVGFGAKAGLFPLHVWLPEAHPAAPSHVSALMSAVMVKTGIYGLLRVLTWLPPAPAWWGLLLAGLGILGALYGIALAAVQRDLKRCLAYSTIENVGIIFLGLGLGLYAASQGLALMAALGFAGALLHLWNHALFKGLLFLGAGGLLHATGTRDLNLMGGLLRRLPLSGALLIGGSLAAIAVPPFNGFVSEWLLYLGLLQGVTQFSGAAAVPPLLLMGLLALTGALALLVFVRLVGIALLGVPRSPAAVGAHEAGPLLLAPQALLLAGCLAMGLFPGAPLRLLSAPLAQLAPPGTAALSLTVPLVWPGRFALLLLAALGAAALLLVALRRARPAAVAETWGCGFARPSARMTYSAEGFSELAHTRLLPAPLRPQVRGEVTAELFPAPARRAQHSSDPVLGRLYHPLFAGLGERCVRLRWLQQGRPAVYLLYIFLTGAALMLWSLWAFGGG
ncbi:proton-conducting transporter transmembrane domain-containing protein [Geoalkalibacter sp.]|uniref:proton-conducting transporter transmembrane domain-containing protein n=1 Tax=Geoalkalibacter sp. TaxID=3041440 RepID=UPI00272EE783|nr:proton-conducting transporter membrane subunit [Geoalkalibacter sp.]